MPWQVDPDGRLRLGLVATDPSRDADIASYMAAAVVIAETHCDRILLRQTIAEKFRPRERRSYYLRGYPVSTFTSLLVKAEDPADDTDFADDRYRVEEESGLILFDRRAEPKTVLEANYEAGYEAPAEVPQNLELALWFVFDEVQHGFQNPRAIEEGRPKSVAIQGVGTIQYDYAATLANNAGSRSSALGSFDPILPLTAATLLEKFRRQSM